MKKISLFLFTLCASVMAWAQNNTEAPRTLNPYAYDLASTWNVNTQTLSISFKLNAVPNLNTTNVDKTITNIGTGIQVNAVDEQGNRYRICAPSTGEIRAAHKATGGHGGSYSYDIQFVNGKSNKTNVTIPTDRLLTWEVRVNGVPSSAGRVYNGFSGNALYNHSLPIYWTLTNNEVYKKKYVAHSVDVDVNPQSPNFGRIFVADGVKTAAEHNSTWSTISHTGYESYKTGGGRGIYIFEPDFVTLKQRAAISLTGSTTPNTGGFADPLEPHDVRVTLDGRIFVCSFSSTSSVAVWQLSSNFKEWTTAITKAQIDNKRVISMDVRGIGNDLVLLLLCAPKNGSTLSCYEYKLSNGTKTSISLPIEVTNFKYYLETINEHTKIAYDSNGDIWVGLGNSSGSRIVRVRDKLVRNYGSYYGGEAFEIKDNLVIKSVGVSGGKTQIHFYNLANNTPYYGEVGQILNSNDGSESGLELGAWVEDFAIDYANNVYIASNYYGRILPISLPYDGVRTTPAPAGQTFTLADPVPNILATDLCCTPHETKPKYIFSFNVNTKPEGAEIRFYNTEAEMLADCNQNEAYSRYDDHSKCQYYYRFTEGELKQGRMLVELDILGHKGDKILTDKKLPSGKLYWNVFIKTRKSLAFAPIYVQPNTGDDLHYRLHATIDNNPDNDGFGHVYAIDYQKVNNDESMKDNPCALMVYTIGDADVDDNNFNGVKSTTRYSLLQNLSTDNMVQPRRPAVAPDGMVYLTDYGDYRHSKFSAELSTLTPSEAFKMGGIWLFDPTLSENKKITGEATLSRFYEASETTSGVSFYGSGSSTILYKSNTYEEISHHGQAHYREEAWANNGYRVYNVGNTDGTINHSAQITDGSLTALPHLDANGSFSVKATSDGVWLCQHRTIAEDAEAVSVLFCNKNGAVKFNSYGANTTNGQPLSNVLKYTPGGGMTVSPDEKYLYVVNYEGNILEFEIGGSAATGKTLTLKNKFINNTDHKTISTMNFDYAGNLVVTTDESYPAEASEKTQIVVFTMPYNRDNARSIPASEAQREIPERLSQDLDNSTTLAIEGTYDVELYRPLQGATFNTICLPFEVDLTTLPAAHKLYGATVMDFTSVSTPSVGNETVLSLNFTKVDKMLAGKPYVIYVEDHVRGLIEFSQVTRKKTVVPQSVVWNVQNSSITYTGVFNPTEIEEGKTILVDQNRLANVTNEGTLSGFRGYFTIPESLRSLKAMISTRHDTPTGLEDMNITERTYQKFLREGRVYIRVGEALYTITGEKVE